MRLAKSMLIFVLLTLVQHKVFAAHIVGGDFSYRHISGDRYELKMKMYRDCGGGGAGFDNPLIVGIYDKENNNKMLEVVLPKVNQYSIKFNTGCTSPQLRCVETGIYKAEFNMPGNQFNNNDGYYVQWERCCRNDIIKNIVDPGSTPMAFYMEFPSPYPGGGPQRLNNSPEFLRDPLNYLCVGEPFKYDFKAYDGEGDKLRMKIGIPNAGRYTSRFDPMQATGPAPYEEVLWQTGYQVGGPAQNIMDGSPDLYVDDDSAFIYLVPTQIGVYVISVICEEYRGGVKIGEIVRELQLEVLNCPPRHKPEISTSLDGGMNVVEAKVNQQVCFDLIANDLDVQEVMKFRIDTGGMYKLVGTSATLNPPDISGVQNITTKFCWTPTCPVDTGNGAFLDFIVYDNSCPFSQDDTVRVKFKLVPELNVVPALKTSLNNNVLNVRKNESACFQFQITDSNATDEVRILPVTKDFDVFSNGATITPDVLVGNSGLSGEFCWRPPCDLKVDSPIHFSFIISDNSCPVAAYDTIDLVINVLPLLNEAPEIVAEGVNIGFDNTVNVVLGTENCFSVLAQDVDPDNIDIYMQKVNYDFEANGAKFTNQQSTQNAKRNLFCWTPSCDNFYGEDELFVDFLTRDNKCDNEKFDTVRVRFKYILPSNEEPLMLKPDSNIYNLNAGYTRNIEVSGSDDDDEDLLILSARPLYNSDLPLRMEMGVAQGNTNVSSVLSIFPDCGLEGNVLYPVELSLLSNKFCNEYDTIKKVVNFKVAPLLDIDRPLVPDVFSPNGDGVNDEYKIYLANRTVCPDEFEFIIFDRWGQKMLETKDPEFVWRGEGCTAGAYVYYLRIGEVKFTGFIALVK